MSDNITLKLATGTYSIRAAGAVLGESANVVELREGGHAPVLYVPRADLAMAFFDKTSRTSHCPHKGDASWAISPSTPTKSPSRQLSRALGMLFCGCGR